MFFCLAERKKENPRSRLSAIREITALDFPLNEGNVSFRGLKGMGEASSGPIYPENRLPRNNSVGTAFVSDWEKMAGQIGACLRKRSEFSFRAINLHSMLERERDFSRMSR